MTYHDRFEEICAEMVALHNKKGADYGSQNDPYANVRASQEFGVDPWIGALIRLNDKITRLKSFIRNGNLVNESVEDSIQDIAVYAVIMRILYDEQKTKRVDFQAGPPPPLGSISRGAPDGGGHPAQINTDSPKRLQYERHQPYDPNRATGVYGQEEQGWHDS